LNPCYGIDYGYVCHLAAHCARVKPEATVEHAMLCEHLQFPHFQAQPGTTLQTLGRLRLALERSGITTAAVAVQREYTRVATPRPTTPTTTPGAALAAAWHTPQQELFA